MTTVTRLMIVDDHSILRKGLAATLNSQLDLEVVAEASSGEEVLRTYRDLSPDIVIMDLKMDGMSGVETTERLRQTFAGAKIIILSSYDRDEDIYRCIRCGAMAYLVKDVSVDELLTCIRSVGSGRKHFPPPISEKLADRLTLSTLSAKEMEVLKLLAKGMTNTRIGDQLCVSSSAVKYHVNNILTKLNATDRTQAVITALKMGLVEL